MIYSRVEVKPECMEEVEKILMKMALLFQTQDDHIDAWGDQTSLVNLELIFLMENVPGL